MSLAKNKQRKQSKSKEQKIAILVAILMAIVPWATSMSAFIKWCMWGGSFACLLYVLYLWADNSWPKPQVIYLIAFCFSWPWIQMQWREEKAATLDGYLWLETSKADEKLVRIGNSQRSTLIAPLFLYPSAARWAEWKP